MRLPGQVKPMRRLFPNFNSEPKGLIMKNLLAQAINKAIATGAKRAAEGDEDETVDDTIVDDEGNEESAEGDEDDKPDAEDDEDDKEAEGDEDEKPDASASGGSVAAARLQERRRCCAIFTHANAEGNPNLAAKLLADGTSKNRAVSILNSVSAGVKTGASLAERVQASQGSKRPGQDGGKKSAGTGQDSEANALVANASSNFGRNKAAKKHLRG